MSFLHFVSRSFVFFFNDTATTEIYTYLHTLSRHDALPISLVNSGTIAGETGAAFTSVTQNSLDNSGILSRSEEHTSELQSLMRISYAVFCLNNKKIELAHIFIILILTLFCRSLILNLLDAPT